MNILILGLVLFLGIHSVRMLAAPFRDAQIAASPGRWKGVYSIISAVGLGLIIWGWILFRPAAAQLYAMMNAQGEGGTDFSGIIRMLRGEG